MVRRVWSDETGSQSLEFVALLPVIIFALLTVLQMAFVGYAVVVAETSAREAALAASRDPARAFSRAQATAAKVSGGTHVTVKNADCAFGDVTVEVEGRVPNLLFDTPITFTRKVVMPTQDGRCS